MDWHTNDIIGETSAIWICQTNQINGAQDMGAKNVEGRDMSEKIIDVKLL